jgi:ribonuclease P protein component
MLAAAHRLRSHSDFTRIVRQGRKSKHGVLVVHVLPGSHTHSRAGFVVSKAIGNSVTRHRVTRRLRAALAAQFALHTSPIDVVVRALPGAQRAGVDQLSSSVNRALSSLGVE